MLKITFVIDSSIRYKYSHSRLPLFYNKIYSLISLYTLSLNKNITSGEIIKYKFNLKRGRTVLMRSPFHYKTSKTIISHPKSKFYFSVIMSDFSKNPFFLDKNFSSLIQKFNSTTNFTCTKIIFHQIRC